MNEFTADFSDIILNLNRILNNPTIHDIQKFNGIIRKSNNRLFDIISNKILLSLIPAIDSEEIRTKPEIQWHLIDTLEVILEKIIVDNEKCYTTILLVLLKQVFDNKSGKLLDTSEELKGSFVRCTRTLSRRTSEDVIEKFFEGSNRNMVAKILLICVQIIEQERFKKLRKDSIECILSFLHIDDEADMEDIVLRSQIADIVYTMLPRLLNCFMEVAQGDTRQGHQLIAISIKAIGRIICLIFEPTDVTLEEKSLNLEDFKELFRESSNDAKKNILKLNANPEGKILRKDKEWIREVVKKLKPYFGKLVVFTQNDHLPVRKEIFFASSALLRKCSENLPDCHESFLRIVFILASDEDEELRGKSRDLLNHLKSHSSYELFVKDAEALIHAQLLILPQSILREDDFMQILGLCTLQSALEFIPQLELLILMAGEFFIDKLSTILILGSELDTKNPNLLTEHFVSESEGIQWKKFRWIINRRCQKALEELCKSLNKPEVIQIVSNHFLQLLRQRIQGSNAILVILNFLTISENGQGKWMEDFFQELLEDVHWNLALQMMTGEDLAIDDIKYNVMHSCLVLECLGNCAAKMGSAFHPYLFKTFHRVLVKAGSSNSCVRSASLNALDQMKTSFGTSTIEDFLSKNADYIVFRVNKFLKKSYTYEDGLGMLQIILEYSNSETRYHVETIMTGLLQDSDKARNTETLKAHFKLYQLFLVKMISLNPEDATNKSETDEEILQKWMDILDQKEDVDIEEIPEGTVEFEPEESEDLKSDQLPPETETYLKETKDIPNYVKLTDDICRLVSKYISSKDQELCLLSLEVLTSGVTILTPYEDNLLPVVDVIWFPLVQKFKSESPVILRQCFNLLCVLAGASQDFIRKRTMTDVIPTINKFLTEVAKQSPTSSQGMYRFTQEYKLISTILSQYGQLLADIQMDKIDQKSFDTSINCALLFLEKNQELQKLAFDFCKTLLNYDAPTIYLKLHKYQQIREKLIII